MTSVLLREGGDNALGTRTTQAQTCCFALCFLSLSHSCVLFGKRHCALYLIPGCAALLPPCQLLPLTSVGTTRRSLSFPDRKMLRLLLVPTLKKRKNESNVTGRLLLSNQNQLWTCFTFSVLLDKRDLCCLICETVNNFMGSERSGLLFTGLNCKSYQPG